MWGVNAVILLIAPVMSALSYALLIENISDYEIDDDMTRIVNVAQRIINTVSKNVFIPVYVQPHSMEAAIRSMNEKTIKAAYYHYYTVNLTAEFLPEKKFESDASSTGGSAYKNSVKQFTSEIVKALNRHTEEIDFPQLLPLKELLYYNRRYPMMILYFFNKHLMGNRAFAEDVAAALKERVMSSDESCVPNCLFSQALCAQVSNAIVRTYLQPATSTATQTLAEAVYTQAPVQYQHLQGALVKEEPLKKRKVYPNELGLEISIDGKTLSAVISTANILSLEPETRYQHIFDLFYQINTGIEKIVSDTSDKILDITYIVHSAIQEDSMIADEIVGVISNFISKTEIQSEYKNIIPEDSRRIILKNSQQYISKMAAPCFNTHLQIIPKDTIIIKFKACSCSDGERCKHLRLACIPFRFLGESKPDMADRFLDSVQRGIDVIKHLHERQRQEYNGTLTFTNIYIPPYEHYMLSKYQIIDLSRFENEPTLLEVIKKALASEQPIWSPAEEKASSDESSSSLLS